MPIKLENVGIAVRDLEAAVTFFTELGLAVVGRDTVMEEALAIAAKHGCHPLRGVATYQDVYKLAYVRGPSGIIVMLAEALKTR